MGKKSTIAPPLSNAVTYILLALAERELHGYGIMQEVLRLSGGEYKVGPGTLYDNLKTLMAEGLVEEVEDEEQEGRRLYRLTGAGTSVLSDELGRLAEVVKAGRRRLGLAQEQEV